MSVATRTIAPAEDRWPAGGVESEDTLDCLLLASHLLGADRAVANIGGGNTSAKGLAADHTGRVIATMGTRADVYVGVALRDGNTHGGRAAVGAMQFAHALFDASDTLVESRFSLRASSSAGSTFASSGFALTSAGTRSKQYINWE